MSGGTASRFPRGQQCRGGLETHFKRFVRQSVGDETPLLGIARLADDPGRGGPALDGFVG